MSASSVTPPGQDDGPEKSGTFQFLNDLSFTNRKRSKRGGVKQREKADTQKIRNYILFTFVESNILKYYQQVCKN